MAEAYSAHYSIRSPSQSTIACVSRQTSAMRLTTSKSWAEVSPLVPPDYPKLFRISLSRLEPTTPRAWERAVFGSPPPRIWFGANGFPRPSQHNSLRQLTWPVKSTIPTSNKLGEFGITWSWPMNRISATALCTRFATTHQRCRGSKKDLQQPPAQQPTSTVYSPYTSANTDTWHCTTTYRGQSMPWRMMPHDYGNSTMRSF